MSAEPAIVTAQYRRLTPEERADHVETLVMLGRLVVLKGARVRVARRSFVVMSVPGLGAARSLR
jgi:hypothetical protein